MKNFEGKTIKLTRDIDLGGYNWTPIGNSSGAAFKGTFNGGNHTISGLSVSAVEDYSGLFGNLSGGTVQNLSVSGTVRGGRNNNGGTGGIVGTNGDTVSECYYLSTAADNDSNGTKMTLTQFKSGQVTWSLQNGNPASGQTWGQNIGTEDYPLLKSSDGVYRVSFYLDSSAETPEKSMYVNVGKTFTTDYKPTSPNSNGKIFAGWCNPYDNNKVWNLGTDTANSRILHLNGVWEDPKDIGSDSICAVEVTNPTYNGSYQSPSNIVVYDISGGSRVKLVKDESYSLTFVPSQKNAGTYNTSSTMIKITGKGNYEGTRYVAWEILPAALTGVSVEQSGTLGYTGDLQTATATAVDGSTVTFTYSTTEDGDYGAMPSFTDAGPHTVYYKASAANHSDAVDSFYVTIGQATPTVTWPSIQDIYVNDTLTDSALTRVVGAGTFSITGVKTWDESGKKTTKVAFQPTDGTNYQTIDTDIEVNVIQRTVKSVDALTAITSKDYGTAQENLGLPASVTIQTVDGKQFENVPVAWSGYNADTLNPQTLTGTLDLSGISKEVKQAEAPDLSAPVLGKDYTVAGLAGDDKLDQTTVVLTCNPDMTKIYEYAIVPSVIGTDSYYTWTLENGTLKVIRHSTPVLPGETYPVVIPDTTEHGTISVDKKTANAGDTVTITVAPGEGYTLERVTVTAQNGNQLKLTDQGDGSYTFKMPDGKVEVNAAFTEKETEPSVPDGFTDVTADDYFHNAVLWAARKEITGGVGNGLFAPNQTCTRAELVTFLWRAVGKPTVNDTISFADVEENTWYTEAVRWAASGKLVLGYDNGLFGTNDLITREQTATILYRYAVARGMDVSVGEDINILSCKDAFDISEYAVSALQWAVGAGIIQGYQGNLMPAGDCTRAQMVTMLYRLLNK